MTVQVGQLLGEIPGGLTVFLSFVKRNSRSSGTGKWTELDARQLPMKFGLISFTLFVQTGKMFGPARSSGVFVNRQCYLSHSQKWPCVMYG